MNTNKTKYYLYIDDSGTRFPDKTDDLVRKDGMDHFALGGVLVADKDIHNIIARHAEFCRKWNITYPLHSTEIRGKRRTFSWLEESAKTNEKFLEELQKLLLSIPVIGFAAVVHRPGYNARYEEIYKEKRWWMCKTAFSILLERVGKYLQKVDGKAEVRFEGVGPKEDNVLITYSKDLKNTGMPFDKNNSIKYESLTAEDFKKLFLGNPRWRKKVNQFVQIADLYLYPMAKRKYDPTYNPWVKLFENKKVIDALIPENQWQKCGIKYSCFDDQTAKDPGKPGSDAPPQTRRPGQSP
jgi:hypothetical protein